MQNLKPLASLYSRTGRFESYLVANPKDRFSHDEAQLKDWDTINVMSRCCMAKPTKDLCAKRRLRSAWAYTQSDQSSMSTWRNIKSIATHWVHSEDSDQTGQMPRLIWVFAGHTWQFVCFVMRRLKSEFGRCTWLETNTELNSFYKHLAAILQRNQAAHLFLQAPLGEGHIKP